MVGNPRETEKTVTESVNLIKKLKPDGLLISKTTIFPGTELYEMAKNVNLINDEYWLTEKSAPLYTVDMSKEQIEYYYRFIKCQYSKMINFRYQRKLIPEDFGGRKIRWVAIILRKLLPFFLYNIICNICYNFLSNIKLNNQKNEKILEKKYEQF